MNKQMYDPIVSERGTRKIKETPSKADNTIEMAKQVNGTQLKFWVVDE